MTRVPLNPANRPGHSGRPQRAHMAAGSRVFNSLAAHPESVRLPGSQRGLSSSANVTAQDGTVPVQCRQRRAGRPGCAGPRTAADRPSMSGAALPQSTPGCPPGRLRLPGTASRPAAGPARQAPLRRAPSRSPATSASRSARPGTGDLHAAICLAEAAADRTESAICADCN
jgi:hypothetical protein